MAYRKIHDDFWTDPDIEELTPEQKYFYLYLITNPSVNQIGLYELSIKRACFETGYNSDTVCKLLEYFEKQGKILRSQKSREILVRKFYYHNKSESPKVKKHVDTLLEGVKDRNLIQYIYDIDIASQEEEVQVQEEVQEEEETSDESQPSQTCYEFDDFWDDYDHKKDRKKSEQKWKKISEAERQKIKEFIPVYKKHQPSNEYRKYPTTFLNSEIWNDDWSAYPPKQNNNNGNNKVRTKGDEHVAFLTRHQR